MEVIDPETHANNTDINGVRIPKASKPYVTQMLTFRLKV